MFVHCVNTHDTDI